MGTGDVIKCILYLLGCTGVCYLFYNSTPWAIVIALLTVPAFYFFERRKNRKKKFERMERQFGRTLEIMAGSMAAGTTFENALKEVAYGKYSDDISLVQKMYVSMDRMICLNCSGEDAVEIMADKSGSREIRCFSCALRSVMGSGGNTVSVLLANGEIIRKKYGAKEEMKNCIAEPVLSGKIMTVMPVVLILLMRNMAPEFMEYLYMGQGRIIMTLVLLLCVAAYITGERIANDFI